MQENDNLVLAPIVLFVYNRPSHTSDVLNALMNNELAKESILYIYSDGPKNKDDVNESIAINSVRKIINEKKWCKQVLVIESDKNLGLAKSIIAGVTQIVNKHGKVIVLEDDIVTSNGFLRYMNDALKVYENNSSIFHISGYMYPHDKCLPNTFFLRVPLCWGWATWKRAWDFACWDTDELINKIDSQLLWAELNQFGNDFLGRQLKMNKSGSLNTWFIKWHSSVFLNNGLVLFPCQSLVQNIGFDNSGIHNQKTDIFSHKKLCSELRVVENLNIINEEAKKITVDFYNKPDTSFLVRKAIKTNLKKSKHFLRPLFNFIFKLIDKILQRVYPGISNTVNWNFITPVSDDLVQGIKTNIYPPYHINNTIVGSFTYISQNSNISNTRIGKFCSIGPNFFCGWGIHPTDGISTSPMFYSTQKQNGISFSQSDKVEERKFIYIGNDVFIGMNVTILDGVTIGDGAIIGAGSIVSKDIPPYAIAVGNPIKIIRYRFSDEEINKLLMIKWWDFDNSKLLDVEKNFFKINEFIELHG